MNRLREGDYYLEPRYDHHKSFYGKAIVHPYFDGADLYSYGTWICSDMLKSGAQAVKLMPELKDHENLNNGWHFCMVSAFWDYSATTLRHFKEFLAQYGYGHLSKRDIECHLRQCEDGNCYLVKSAWNELI